MNDRLGCSEPNCEASLPNHSWGKIKAEGWFFSRDDKTRFCPEHLPDWVAGWRRYAKKS